MNFAFALPQQSAAKASPSPLAASAGAAATSSSAGLSVDPCALELTLQGLRPFLARSDVTEVCINSPGEAFLETRSGWVRESLPFADFNWCRRLSKLIA